MADGLRDRPHRTIAAATTRPSTLVGRPRSSQADATFDSERDVLAPIGTGRTATLGVFVRLRTLAAAALLLLSLGSMPSVAAAAEGLTMEAHTLLDGHARVGSWMAIAVHLKNDGPPIQGELRLSGGSQGRTRFGTVVDLPTQSDKTYVLYAQPPAFGREMEIALVVGRPEGRDHQDARSPIHDASQMTIGVVAERPGDDRRRASTSSPTRTSSARSIVQLTPGGPARARRGVGRPRPHRLAGRRLEPPHDGPAGGPAGLARRRRPPRHRRRHVRPEQPRPPSRTPCCRTGRPPRSTSRRARSRRSRPVPAGTPDLPALGGDLGRRSRARVERRSRHRGRAAVRQRRGDDHRLRPDDAVARRRLGDQGPLAPGPARARVDRRPRRRRQPAPRRGVAAPAGRPAADRRPHRPARRLHPAGRPGELPRPQAPRPARVGLGHDAGPHRSSSRSGRTRSAPCSAAATSSSTRSPSSAAHRARPTGRPRSTSGSSRRRATSTRSRCRAAPCCPRRSRATSSAATAPRRGARHPPGRPGPGPRPRRQLRLAAHDPRRDAGQRPAHRGRPPARRRAPAGDHPERVRRRPSRTPRSCSGRRSRCSTTSRPARPRTSMSRSRPSRSASRCPTASSGRRSSPTRRTRPPTR